MEPLQVLLFGGFDLRRGDESAPPIPSRSARSLFAHLVVHRDVRHPRERLAERFWPDVPPARARRRLSHALWQIQDALGELVGDVPYLDTSGDRLAFAPGGPCWVDVEEFERRLERLRARRAEGPGRARDLSELEQIVDLYRGEFLSGHYEDWVIAEQDRLQQRYLEALTWLVSVAKGHGAYDDALVYARRLTNQDPLREDGHREVMRLSMLLGRTSEAIRQYERCREVLAEELGTEPAAPTTQLYERIVRQRDLGWTGSLPEPIPFPDRLPLVGRDRERTASVALLERALAGRGGTVLVEADPGVGKTRLLTEVVDDAHWRGFAVLHAACRGPEGPGPYGVLQDVLLATLTPLRVEQLRHRLDPVWLAQLAVLVPGIRRVMPPDLAPTASLRQDEGAQRMRDALVRAVAALAEIDPLLLVVDDLQWADEESLAVLEAVASSAAERRLVVLLAYRADEARGRDAVWEAIRGIDRRTRPERLLLGPLDPFSTAELVRVVGRGHSVDPAVASRLRRETGGNPLFVIETLRTMAEEQRLTDLERSDAEQLPLPGSIRELVLHRLDRLPSEVRTVLDAAAVAGDGTDLDTLVQATELPAPAVADAADLLLRRSLLREVGDAFGLHHDQMRRVVASTLSEGARRALHRRVGEALEAQHPDRVERLAHHFAEAGSIPKAVTYLRRAGRAAVAVHAYATADTHYRRAVELQGARPASVAARFELLAEHETVLEVLGDRARQREAVGEMAALAAGDRRREVEASRRRALLDGQTGDPEGAVEVAGRAVAGAEELDDPPLLGACLETLATVLTWAGKRPEAVPLLARAAELATEGPAEAEVRALLGSVLRELQRYDEAEQHLDRALELAREHGALRQEARTLGVLGTVRMETADPTGADELYRRATERCRAIGLRRGEAINRLNHANVLHVLGEVGAALEAYADALAILEDLEDRRTRALALLNLGFVRHATVGDDVAARRCVDDALAFFREVGDAQLAAHALDTLAGIALRRGDTGTARQLADEAVADAERGGERWERAQARLRRAEVALAAGDPETALGELRTAGHDADGHGFSDLQPALLAAEGRARLALGDADGALAVTAEAVERLHPGVERRHLVLLAHSDVLRTCGRADAATAAVDRARDELERLLATLGEDDRRHALRVPEHRRILGPRAPGGREGRVVRVAARDAPTGRPLDASELLELTVDVSPGDDAPEDPVERRRWLLQRVVSQVVDGGGLTTVRDLARILEVSEATVRRDLQALRRQGRDLPTRGRRTG